MQTFDFPHSGFHPTQPPDAADRRQGGRRTTDVLITGSHHPGCPEPCISIIKTEVERVVTESRLDQREYFTELLTKQTDTLVKLLESSVPDGDFQGHRKAHESYIQAAAARREFWRKMIFELSKWGAIAFLGWLAVQIWIGALNGPKH